MLTIFLKYAIILASHKLIISILGKLYLGKRRFLFLLMPEMDLSLCDNNERGAFSVR